MVVLGGSKFLMSEVRLYKPPGEAISRASRAHGRQSRADLGLDFGAKVLKTFLVFPRRSAAGLYQTTFASSTLRDSRGRERQRKRERESVCR